MKIIKKIIISILILYMCISSISTLTPNSYATEISSSNNILSNAVGEDTEPWTTLTPVPTTTETPTPATERITRERVCSDEKSQTTGFRYYIHVGNVTYTHYYQKIGYYKNYIPPGWRTSTISSDGCGIVSCANLLSGYGKSVDPWQVAQEYNSRGIKGVLEDYGVTRNLV